MSARPRKMANRKPRGKSVAERGKGSAKKPSGKRDADRAKQRKATPRRRAAAAIANVYHPGPLIDAEEALEAAINRLMTLDPEIVGKIVAACGRPLLRRREPGFAGLVWIIV